MGVHRAQAHDELVGDVLIGLAQRVIAAAALGSLLAGPLAGWSGLRAPLNAGALVYAITLAVSLRSLRAALPGDARAAAVEVPADLLAA